MFNAPFKTSILATLGAAFVATSLSLTPAFAGGDGGGGGDRAGDRGRVSTIESTDADGNTVSIRSRNDAPTYTLTRSRNGKVESKKEVRKKSKTFVTLHNPDGSSRTIYSVTRDRTPSVTIHNADGTTRTISGNNR
ncbi:MAG: hypothetical protein RIG84_02750 [Roseovarius sp.]